VHRCSVGGCENEATFQVEVRLWALVMPVKDRNPGNCIRMITSVLLCDEHKSAARVEDFLTPSSKEQIGTLVSDAGRADPDFLGAKLELLEIEDGQHLLSTLRSVMSHG
jgi:hypothetical protein